MAQELKLRLLKQVAREHGKNLIDLDDWNWCEKTLESRITTANKIAMGLQSSGKITFAKQSFSDLATAGGLTVEALQKQFPNWSVTEILLYLDIISLA